MGRRNNLERATELGRVVYTQDDDFLAIAKEWHDVGRGFAGLVYSHQMSITIGRAVRDLQLVADVFEADEMRSRIEFIPI